MYLAMAELQQVQREKVEFRSLTGLRTAFKGGNRDAGS